MKDALLPMLNPPRLLRSLYRNGLMDRGSSKPTPCPCGATFTSFRARKQHIATAHPLGSNPSACDIPTEETP